MYRLKLVYRIVEEFRYIRFVRFIYNLIFSGYADSADFSMLYLLIILLELTVLLLFSMIIPSLLTQIFYFFTRSHKVAIYLLSIIVLPGTLVHEMAHLLTAGGMLVRVGEVSLFPEIKEGGVKLGHVEIEKTDFIRRAFIGFAPVFFGLAILAGGVWFANDRFFSQGYYPIWLVLVLFYLVVVIGNTMFSSKKDLEGTLGFLVLMISLLGAVYFAGFNQIFNYLKNNLVESHLSFYQSLAYFLAVPVIGDILVYLFAKLLVKRMY